MWIFLQAHKPCQNVFCSLQISVRTFVSLQLIAENEKLQKELSVLRTVDNAASTKGNFMGVVKEVRQYSDQLWMELSVPISF
jgi:hypothetical protein